MVENTRPVETPRRGVSTTTTIIDGGLATELERRGHDLRHRLWSARLLDSAPDEIAAVHRAYLDAGADCIITASYQATLVGFEQAGYSAEKARTLLQRAVTIAVDTRDQWWAQQSADSQRRKPLVAASIGPYGAFLANGAEYTGDYDLDEDGLRAFHQPRWALLAQGSADLLACETLPSLTEARALLALLETTPNQTAWFSFSCRDGAHISDGTPIAAAASLLDTHPQVVAVGINCTAPRYIAPLLTTLAAHTQKPLLVYPNSGEQYDAQTHCWLPDSNYTAQTFAAQAETWFEAGARWIGGCCRTGPSEIAALRTRLVPKIG